FNPTPTSLNPTTGPTSPVPPASAAPTSSAISRSPNLPGSSGYARRRRQGTLGAGRGRREERRKRGAIKAGDKEGRRSFCRSEFYFSLKKALPGALVTCKPIKGIPLVTVTQLPEARFVVIWTTLYVPSPKAPY